MPANRKLGKLASYLTINESTRQITIGSTNRYLFYKKDREESGVLQPRDISKTRPSSGQVYPRRLVLHYKK
jgi:hypothetical protein